jgi:hypothetical protein
MSFHKDLLDGNIHVIYDKEYIDTTARDADTTWNGDSANIGKAVRVNAGPTFFLLNTIAPTWLELTTTASATLAGVLAIGNLTGGTDIVVDTGDVVTLTDAPVAGTDATNKTYVDAQVGANNELSEILANGNTTGGTDIVVDTGDVITITDAPIVGTAGANMTYVDGENATQDTAIGLNTTHRTSAGTDHSDVVLNNTHRTSAGIDHSDVVLNNAHRVSDGKDHSDVVLNNTHRTSDGSDHTFIDQDVTTTAKPEFVDPTATQGAATKTYVDTADALRVVGPVSSLDNEAPLFDGTTGKLLKGSGVTIDQITPVTADFGALNQAATQTLLDQNKAKRIVGTFSEVSAVQMTTDGVGTAVYAGVNGATLQLISTITGTVSTGTNIDVNFYAAKGNTGVTITAVADAGGGQLTVTTSAAHGFANGDRVLQEATTDYNDDYTISNITATTYEITETFVATEAGTVAMLLLVTKASNTFVASASKNTVVVGHIAVVPDDFLYIAVENVGNAGEWNLDDIHVLFTRA